MKFTPHKLEFIAKLAGFKIPNISPDEFECVVCNRVKPPDEFQSYDPLVCIDCDLIDLACKLKW